MNAKWDERFMRLAEYISAWSKDPTTAVGCVVVGLDKRDVAFGYNGFPAGVRDDERLHDRDLKNLITRHAEANALTACRSRFLPDTIYVTHFPCVRKGCASAIIAEGLRRVVAPEPDGEFMERWGDDYRLARQLFAEAGLQVDLFNRDGAA
jgi:dCMP deaminase